MECSERKREAQEEHEKRLAANMKESKNILLACKQEKCCKRRDGGIKDQKGNVLMESQVITDLLSKYFTLIFTNGQDVTGILATDDVVESLQGA